MISAIIANFRKIEYIFILYILHLGQKVVVEKFEDTFDTIATEERDTSLKAMSQLLRHSCRRAVTAWQRQPTQQNDVALHASALRPLTTDSRGRDVTNPNLPPSMVKSITDNERLTAEFNSKLRPSSSSKAPFSSSIPVFSLRDQSVLSILDLPQENASQPAPLPFTLAPSISGGVQPSIAPPPLPIQQQKEIRDPVKEVTVVISDGRPEQAKIGDQP